MNEAIALTETTYYILLALLNPQHGYGIMQQVEEMSRGRIRLAAGTLYGALGGMSDKGWIIQLPVEPGSRRKDYRITRKGMDILTAELNRLKELTENGIRILEDPEHLLTEGERK